MSLDNFEKIDLKKRWPLQIFRGMKSRHALAMYLTIKRCFDVVAAAAGLIILAPALILIALAIWLEDGSPVIHKRWCVGWNGPYAMLKFRTMVKDADHLDKYLSAEQIEAYRRNVKVDRDPRVTRVGSFLRRASLDELPQLVNVLRNEMSLVGPRPMVEEEAVRYGNDAPLVLSVKPGITGYWQVKGRSDCTYESGERQRLELYYVYHRCLGLDISILLQTFRAVLSRKGAR